MEDTRILMEDTRILTGITKQMTAEIESVQLEQKVAREYMSSFIRQRVAGRSGLWARLVNKFSSDKKMLADSALFDADWYLQNYPDVPEARAPT